MSAKPIRRLVLSVHDPQWAESMFLMGAATFLLSVDRLTIDRTGLARCRFCGDWRESVDQWGDCKICVDGMARTNGD